MFAFFILAFVVPLPLFALWGAGYWVLATQRSTVAFNLVVILGVTLWFLIRIAAGHRNKQWPNARKEKWAFVKKEFRYILMTGLFPFVYLNFIFRLSYPGCKNHVP